MPDGQGPAVVVRPYRFRFLDHGGARGVGTASGETGNWAGGHMGQQLLPTGIEVFRYLTPGMAIRVHNCATTPRRAEAQAKVAQAHHRPSSPTQHPRAKVAGVKAPKSPYPLGCPWELIWSLDSGHLPLKPACSPGVASGEPGFLANLVNAKFLWSIATCHPKKSTQYITGLSFPKAGPSSTTQMVPPLFH